MEVGFSFPFRDGVATDRQGTREHVVFKPGKYNYFTGLNHVFISALFVGIPTQKRKKTTSTARDYTGVSLG